MLEAINGIEENIISDKIFFYRYGAGRSASVVISYLCSIGFDYPEAINFVASKKRGINPLPLLTAETVRTDMEKKESLYKAVAK